MTDETAAGAVRIGRAGVTFSGRVDPTVARAVVERALASLATTGLPGRGHLADLRVDVRVPHGQAGEQRMAEATAAAVAAAVRQEAGR